MRTRELLREFGIDEAGVPWPAAVMQETGDRLYPELLKALQ
ncbi:MAG TPA: hypothetical protein VK993_00375 [Chthoniobacterales bacterium]|nr:hypothetical protein [Chthoniobacterales bacterium]